jgi:predicted GIY-YIG superfamily endonuclease
MSTGEVPARFEKICRDRLPNFLGIVRKRMDDPFPLSRIAVSGVGEKTALSMFAEAYGIPISDFPGAYVLVENGGAIYVGISKHVARRLLQHLKGRTHFSASLAYKMAAMNGAGSARRSENMDDQTFMKRFRDAQERIGRCGVAVIEIDDPIELYLFEVFAALELGTLHYNRFETH